MVVIVIMLSVLVIAVMCYCLDNEQAAHEESDAPFEGGELIR